MSAALREPLAAVAIVFFVATFATAQPVSVKDDPLVRMPGSQPAPEGAVTLEGPGRCLNCHADYNTAVEPGFNWKGSMMAHAARDFLFWSCLTVAAQDSAWAIGRPNATDICLRCHFPQGWLEGRSDPPNGAAMLGDDFDGVHCDFCHRSVDPFHAATSDGSREGDDWLGYWDETDASGTPSTPAALATLVEDELVTAALRLFNGEPAYALGVPRSTYTESGSGQYVVSPSADKRASFADAQARHRMLYSRHHKSTYFCATCHDVSNPVLANLILGGVGVEETRADFGPGRALHTETAPAYAYFHVERTFSEFLLSAYGQPGGAPGLGPFAPESFSTSNPGSFIARCQDCHMRDVSGAGCDKNGTIIRPGESTEHPRSGQPLHDLTGGNAWVSWVLASAVPGSPNHDPVNEALLHQGPGALTLDMSAGLGVDPVALLAGAERAREQLELAAAIEDLEYDPTTGALSFHVQNRTGHKLISGFPEGRRLFVRVAVYAGETLVHEINPYDADAATLKGLSYSYRPDPNGSLPLPAPLAAHEAYVDELVYEMHPSSSLTGEDETFHFALSDARYKDNRIPPRGFLIDAALERLAQPVWHGEDAPGYFTAEEYAGGYDEVEVDVPAGADTIVVEAYYQTTSREYIEFLRDEINGDGNRTLPDEAYIAQTDRFFDGLRAWGPTIWDLWSRNRDVPGAAPVLVAQARIGTGGGAGCALAAPTLDSAVPGNQEVTIAWSHAQASEPNAAFQIYYDQEGKSQWVATVAGPTTSFTDTGLENGQSHCYKVSFLFLDDPSCESAASAALCATPTQPGQAGAGVDSLVTGKLSGKGRSQTFTATTTFQVGDGVVIRAHVVDVASGEPISGASVELTITGPETVTVSSAPSDATGVAEATWSTSSPNRKGQGGTTAGTYTATVTGVSASGHSWDRVRTSTSFDVQ